MKKIIYTALLCLIANTLLSQVVNVANLTSGQYQKKFDALVQQGYRPIKVWSKVLGVFDYTDGEGPSFGFWGTFQKVPNTTPWAAKHGIDAAAYQKEFNARTAQGYMPTDMNVACVSNQVRYCVIYDKIPNALPWVAKHNINSADFQKANADLISKGYRLKLKSSCRTGNGYVFAALWQK